jgi:hypothetical protein
LPHLVLHGVLRELVPELLLALKPVKSGFCFGGHFGVSLL